MRNLTSRAWRAAALTAVPLAVASLALSPAAQASVHAPAAGLTWHKLFAINGWNSAQSRYGTGDPSWAVSNGVVYLSGSVKRGSGTSTLFAQLPPQARPAHNIWLTVYTLNESSGTLEIKPNGKVYASSTPQSNAAGYTSLAGVSFPAKSVHPTSMTLINGWHSEQTAWNTGAPGYVVRSGIVYLTGALGGGSNSEFTVLPKAARPSRVEYLSVYTFGGTHGTLVIKPNGLATASSGDAASFTSLSGVSYPAASVGHTKIHLINGWHSEQGVWNSGDPGFTVRGGVVYLSGSLATAGSNETFGVLPKGARPSHLLYIQTYTESDTIGTVFIDPNGTIEAYSTPRANAEAYTSLARISFPVKS